jgi:anthranilate synthase component 1
MSQFEVPTEFRIQPGILNGAAFGYITYDCVRYFETKVDQYIQPDVLDIPESLFMFTNSFAYFDHLNKSAKLVVLCPISHDIADVYAAAVQRLHELSTRLGAPEPELTNTRSPGFASCACPHAVSTIM